MPGSTVLAPVDGRWTRQQAAIVVAATVAVAAISLTQVMSVPLLPYLVEEWGVDRATVSWVATATLLASAAVNPVVGRLGDLIDMRPLLLGSVGVTVAGSLLGMMARSLPLLVAARVVQGLGSALVPLAFAVVRRHLPSHRLARGAAMVVVGGVGIGVGLGLVVAGFAVERGGVAAVFGVAAVGAALAAVLLVRSVPAAPGAALGPVSFDVVGGVGCVVVLVSGLLAITKGGAWGWTSPPIVALFGGGVVAGAIWVWWERRQVAPLVDFEVSARPFVAMGHLGGVVAGFATFAVSITVVTLVRTPAATGHGLGRSLVVAGLVQVPGAVALVVVVLALSSRRTARWPLARMMAAGAGVVAIGFVLAALWHGSLLALAFAVIVVNVGIGGLFAAAPLLVLRGVADHETAAANAANAVARLVGSVIASALASAVLATRSVVVDGVRYPARATFVVVDLLAAGVALVAAWASMRLARRT